MASQELSRPHGDSRRNIRLVRARFNAGLTQRDLAARSGLSRTAIADLEGGARPKPSNAKSIADVLGCQPLDLFSVVDDTDLEPAA